MTREKLSRITCAVDAELAEEVLAALGELRLPEVFVQGAKQLSLDERPGRFGLRERVLVSEERAEVFRFCVPGAYEAAVSERIASVADLRIPGRGILFAETVESIRNRDLSFDEKRLSSLGPAGGISGEPYSLLSCILQRGAGDPLARAILDLGMCVPLVSFGEGMGLRGKLGLLRIAVPVEKEMMHFLVPERDAGFLEDVALQKARLDRPGQGFIYACQVRAAVVNLRVRKAAKRHAATFDQVISVLDEIRGSSEWRRLSVQRSRSGGSCPDDGRGFSACLSISCDAGRAQDFVNAAMDAGAGGATLESLAWHGFSGDDGAKVSHARETCSLVIDDSLVEPVLETLGWHGLFSEGAYGAAELLRECTTPCRRS